MTAWLIEIRCSSCSADLAKIRGAYISKCMGYFKESLESKDSTRVDRCLSLLNNQLDSSEGKGVRGLPSHGGSATKGASLNLVVQNTIRKSPKAATFTVKVHMQDTLWEVRANVANVSQSVSRGPAVD